MKRKRGKKKSIAIMCENCENFVPKKIIFWCEGKEFEAL